MHPHAPELLGSMLARLGDGGPEVRDCICFIGDLHARNRFQHILEAGQSGSLARLFATTAIASCCSMSRSKAFAACYEQI
jgi:hypothetical protein